MEHRGCAAGLTGTRPFERECGELVVVGRRTDVCDPGTLAVCGWKRLAGAVRPGTLGRGLVRGSAVERSLSAGSIRCASPGRGCERQGRGRTGRDAEAG